MSTLIVVLIALCGLTLLPPTERQVRRDREGPGSGHLQERVALLRELGLLRR